MKILLPYSSTYYYAEDIKMPCEDERYSVTKILAPYTYTCYYCCHMILHMLFIHTHIVTHATCHNHKKDIQDDITWCYWVKVKIFSLPYKKVTLH